MTRATVEVEVARRAQATRVITQLLMRHKGTARQSSASEGRSGIMPSRHGRASVKDTAKHERGVCACLQPGRRWAPVSRFVRTPSLRAIRLIRICEVHIRAASCGGSLDQASREGRSL